MSFGPSELLKAMDFRVSELFGKLDFWVGVAMGVGGVWLAVASPKGLDSILPVAVSVVGVIVGAVIAAVAVLSAFLDQRFLRRLDAIQRDPVRYYAPFMFTALLGVVALLLLLVLSAVPSTAPDWFTGPLTGLSAFSAGWTIASLLFDLDVLVQFIRLQQVAARGSESSSEEREIDCVPS